jgi:hypothetical protein
MRPTIIVVFLAAITVAFAGAAGAEPVTFRSSETTCGGEPLVLKGQPVEPEGSGPFPAVILMQGCCGGFHRS